MTMRFRRDRIGYGRRKRIRGMGGELEVLQAVNNLLGKCLSTRVEKAKVRYEQLPEWQKKSSLRLPVPIQLIACQMQEI